MVALEHLDDDSQSLHPLPPHIHRWLRAVVVFGFLSFVSSVTLLLLLIYRLFRWKIKSRRSNQFVILILNLVLADIQQSCAFLLNVEWLRIDSVNVLSPACWAQGWFVSTGDLASGVWCFTIALHTFASVVFDYRLRRRWFYTVIAALWLFIYGISLIPVALHPNDLYVRAGVWCWVHHSHANLRLWAHYIWIFFFEFGNILIYAMIYFILYHRIRHNYYTEDQISRVKSILNLMVVYPIVYVVCTLPLASARMASMFDRPPSWGRLCFSALMITSNGWLDVLLYTLTRRILLFSDEPPPDNNGIDTFSPIWRHSAKRFGAMTTIETTAVKQPKHKKKSSHVRAGRGLVSLQSRDDSSDDLCGVGTNNIKLETTTTVFSELAVQADLEEMEAERKRRRPPTPTERYSEESDIGFKLERIPD
ncbi:integral membrane protein-like protein [Delitschia confertaspora ATCC 74209]|uniref:Integral membrane protein-like protein n=1 Tax=Delitschia confertaspora ATCC 74209 TaxID=1513339 RepID=A0A9P4MQV3_9PLEO|nr:integral membrane protein-like protein [Delitschia confertaspora ATCC 74209]